MATWTTSWFGTNNDAVFFRFKITENYSSTTGKRLLLQLQVKKTTAASLESRAPGYVTWYLNGTSQGQMSLGTLILPANNSVQTVAAAEKYVTLTDASTSATIKANFEMPKATIGKNNTGSKNVTLTKYTVSFNANGGSGSYSSVSVAYRNTISLTSYKPTRTGHTLLGWSTSSTATSASYTSSVMIGGTCTLYAVWKANTYTITYNANGGSGAPASHSYTYATSGSTKLSSTVPTRTGYVFLGWSLSSTATSASYAAGQNWNLSNASNYTLYAVWVQTEFIQTIMARYQQPDGSFSDYSQIYAAALEEGDSVNWVLDGNDEYKTARVSYVVGKESLVTYVDIYRKQYTITYDANGGVCPPKQQTFYYGCNLYLSNKRPCRSGYLFKGWSTSRIASDGEYKQNDRFNSTDISHLTLYAIWEKRHSNIYFYRDGMAKFCELVESNKFKISENGRIYAQSFIEDDSGNISFGKNFRFAQFSEIFFEEVVLVDESENILTDENGNQLIILEEV